MRKTTGPWRKAILWMSGMLVWVFALSAGLAWYQFGYLDVKTVTSMGLVLIPLLVVAVGVVLWADLKERREEEEEEGERDARARKPIESIGDRQ